MSTEEERRRYEEQQKIMYANRRKIAESVMTEEYPDVDVKASAIPGEVSGSVVFLVADKVYKVIISTNETPRDDMIDEEIHAFSASERAVTYANREAETLQALGPRNVSPLLVEYRTGNTAPRLPILVMQRVDFDNNDAAFFPSAQALSQELDRVATVLDEVGFFPNDIEPVWDRSNDGLRLIDLGGMGRVSDTNIQMRMTMLQNAYGLAGRPRRDLIRAELTGLLPLPLKAIGPT